MCGIFGIYNDQKASWRTYFGLLALQHRGHETAGIAVSSDNSINVYKNRGLVPIIFDEKILEAIGGNAAIGHVRYSTVAGTSFIQPFKTERPFDIALGHNGQINFRKDCQEQFKDCSSNDSQRLLHMISNSKEQNIEDMVEDILTEIIDVDGSYALVVLSQGKLIGARDPVGYRPLSLGRLDDSYVLASESCAFDVLGAKFVRDIEPGEIIIMDEDGLNSRYLPKRIQSLCIFELIYFGRPDSYIYGKNVAKVRRAFGRQLAKEHPANADIVFPIPDSGDEAAMGYSECSGIPFEPYAIIRNHFIGRTFILPDQIMRELGVRVKLNPNKGLVEGIKGVDVEDSIVRATTLPRINARLREAGISEIHSRVSSPPYCLPCYYGIDTPRKEELAAATRTVEEIRKLIKADTLGYLSLGGMLGIEELRGMQFCTKCFQ